MSRTVSKLLAESARRYSVEKFFFYRCIPKHCRSRAARWRWREDKFRPHSQLFSRQSAFRIVAVVITLSARCAQKCLKQLMGKVPFSGRKQRDTAGGLADTWDTTGATVVPPARILNIYAASSHSPLSYTPCKSATPLCRSNAKRMYYLGSAMEEARL